MREILEKLLRREPLDIPETGQLFDSLIGDTPAEMKAALLAALRAKGETETEIAGMAQNMRRHAVSLPADLCDALDTCGTGGDGSRSLNISTLAAIVLSSMGVPIVKHGNRSVSSSCGSADLLEKLGLPLDLTPAGAAELFRRTRFTFLFAPLYHPAMKSVAPVRKALQIRTIFNFLGPLSNPAQVKFQILGVPARERVRPFAEVLKRLGLTSAAVVHGEPAMDEVSPCGKTFVACFINGGEIREETWSLSDLGISKVALETLSIANADESAVRSRQILAGAAESADIDSVAANAGAGLWITGKTRTVGEGVAQARAHIQHGEAGRHFDLIVKTATEIKAPK